MVFLSAISFIRSRGPDEFWRKRKILRIAAHFYGRKRNCYGIAIRYVHRALLYTTRGRKLKKQDMKELWKTRIDAGASEHNLTYKLVREGLLRCNILLDHKSLSDLSCWEPRTFKSLTDIACTRVKQDGLKEVVNVEIPPNVITKGNIE